MNTFIKKLILIFFLGAAFTQLRAQSYGYIQITHNCADPSLDTIDLYFDGNNTNIPYAFEDSNVVYHAASGLIQVPTDTAFTIGIAYKHSYANQYDTIRTFTFPAGTLSPDERKVFILSGVNGSGFEPNPNGISTALNMLVTDIDTLVPDTAYVSLRFFQGATDLNTVQLKHRNGGQVIPGAFQYGTSTTTFNLVRHNAYEFQVTSPDTSYNYGTFSVNLSDLGGNSILILGSGFIHPNANNSGPAFGLFGLLNTGGVLTFPLETAGFQLLHNCADPAADSLDIYIDSLKTYPNMGFRNSTPVLGINAYSTFNVAIAPKNSTSIGQAIWQHTFFFPRDTFYVATISGLLSQTGFAPNPSGISTALNVLIKSPAEFAAASGQDFDFFMINGVTDAPPLNLVPTGGPYLLTNVAYADQTSYVSLPSEFYDLDIQDTLGNNLEKGFANFLAFQSQSGVLLTSGFLTPANNNNGPAMGLFMVDSTGGPFIPLYTPAGINKIEASTAFQVFPNPASNLLRVRFTLSKSENVSLQITDINGQLIQQVLSNQSLTGTQNITVDLTNLAEGIYLSRLITSEGTNNCKFGVVK